MIRRKWERNEKFSFVFCEVIVLQILVHRYSKTETCVHSPQHFEKKIELEKNQAEPTKALSVEDIIVLEATLHDLPNVLPSTMKGRWENA